ncbi:hypothetical protein CWI75_00005, partial [Kineobactrum sediminis]
MADTAIATVVAITGTAYARSANGELRQIKPGDVLLEGETVVTPNGGSVELSLADGNPFEISGVPEMTLTRDIVAERAAGREESAVEDETVEALLAALEGDGDIGDVLDATAAGGQEGGGGEGSSFVRLGRVVEETDEFSTLTAETSAAETTQVVDGDTILSVDAVDDAVTIEVDQSTIINVLANDIFADGVTVTAVSGPANGSVTVNADNTITYTPNEGFSGEDSFSYTATSPDGNSQDAAVVRVTVASEAVAPIIISANTQDVVEGGIAEVVFTLSEPSTTPITVDFETVDGTATGADGDFDALAGTVTFAPGETTASIFIQVNEDDALEGTEQFSVNLSNPVGADLQAEQIDITIIDDFVPTVSINDATVTEGGIAELTLSLSAAVNSPVTVQFGSFDGTATVVGGDYDPVTGTVAFGPGQTSATILVQTNTDTLAEGSEEFTVDLVNASGATIANGQGTVTIVDGTVEQPPTNADVLVGAGAGGQVSESGLAEGSAPEPGGATMNGVITYIAPDTPVTINIEGQQVTAVGQTFTGTFGSLTITSISANNIGYTYTLEQSTSGDSAAERFGVQVTDVDGDSAQGNLVIDIVDDVPTAADDVALVPADSFDSVSGNVLDNDIQGADGAAVAGVALGDTGTALNDAATVGTDIQGQYGVLTIDADGTYSYVRDPGTPGGVDDTFTYPLRDADGDSSTATLVVSLGNSDVTVNLASVEDSGTIVSEAGLAAGSDAAADSETTTGSFSFAA